MISAYLPSAKLVTMALSLALAGGLVTAAQYATGEHSAGSLAAAPENASADPNWEQTLEQIQLDAGITAPAPAPQEAVEELLAAAQSPNLTTSIGRSLLVNLSAASSEGLGADVPTQEAIVEAAAAEVGAGIKSSYSAAELIQVPQSPESLRAYGNAAMAAMGSYPAANATIVLVAFGEALDYRDSSKLAPLRAAQEAYASLAGALAALLVPETLAPLHAQIASDLATMGKAAGEMATVLDDPLRGLGGLQVYQSSADEATRLLTTVAGILGNNGIIFSKDDPGAAWSAFASP